jgi:DNA-binding NarL/FixJ family response regulator
VTYSTDTESIPSISESLAAMSASETGVGTGGMGGPPEMDLATTWREIVHGVFRIHGSFFTSERCGLTLQRSLAERHSSLSGRRLEIIEAVLSGIGQNCVAIDLNLAPSTVALITRQTLESMGALGRPSRVHPLLMLMATAARTGALVSGSVSLVPSEHEDLQVLEIARPGRRLLASLPAAERQVVELLVEGQCYSEIAKARGTSERTVANQIAAVFRRLNASGRSELILRLFAADGLIPFPRRGRSLPSLGTPEPPRLPPPASTAPPPTWREPLASRSRDALRSSGVRPLAEMSPRLQDYVASVRSR